MRRGLRVLQLGMGLVLVVVAATPASAAVLGEVDGSDDNGPVSSFAISPTTGKMHVAWAEDGGDDLWWGKWTGTTWVKTQVAGQGTFGACYYSEIDTDPYLGPVAGFTLAGGARIVAPCWPTGSSSTITWYRLIAGVWKKSVIIGLSSDGDGSCPAHGSVDLAFDPDDGEASIVIGRSGGSNINQKYVYWIHHTPTGWKKEAVAAGSGLCTEAPLPSISFDPVSGEPAVAWNTAALDPGTLLYSARGGAAWVQDEPVEEGTVVGVPSLGFAPDGTPWIAYRSGSESASMLRVAHRVGGVWEITDVDATSTNTGLHPSLVVTPGGVPRVAYHDQSTGDLRWAKYNATTDSWTLSTIESTGDVGEYPSAAFTAGGKARISYYKRTGESIRWARL